MKQTPLQKLVEWVDKMNNSIFALQSSEIELKMLQQFKTKIQSLLPYEQEWATDCHIEIMNK
jgi:hypothetical protein